MNSIQLGSRRIYANSRPYVIAEIGVNHEGSIELAKTLIREARDGGADCAKFQSYKASKLASIDSPAYWDTKQETTASQFALFKKYDAFSADDYRELADYCSLVGIDFASTPFDDESAEYLNSLVPFFKIASADITNVPLLRKVGSMGKPVILSTGASNLDEIQWAKAILQRQGCSEVILMHCILNYPTLNKNAHLRMIKGLKQEFSDSLIGYSDHTLPDDRLSNLLAAWLLGACVIEKHFTNDKKQEGNDHYHAMDRIDLSNFISQVEILDQVIGGTSSKYAIETEELARINARRSIVLARPVGVGHIIQETDIIPKRPGTGISPLQWDEVIGSVVKTQLPVDHVLQWSDLDRPLGSR